MSSSAIQLSSSVCVQVTLTVAYSWAHTRSTEPTMPSPVTGGVQGNLHVERCLRTGDDIDGGDGRSRVDAAYAHGNRGVLVGGHIDDDAFGGMLSKVGIGGLAHAGLEASAGASSSSSLMAPAW